MMRANVAAVGLVLALGCFKPAPILPPPPSLVEAMRLADEAVATSGDIGGTCDALAQEISRHSQASLPIMMKADLNSLFREVAAFGAVNDAPMLKSVPVEQWNDLRARLDRVLQGKNPTEGPRYHLDLPEPVRSGMSAVDSALAAGDVDAARTAMARLEGPLSEWMGKLPGMRAAAINQVIERDLAVMGMPTSKPPSLSALKAQWAEMRTTIDPSLK